ncbi:hypothetical protein [Rhodopirellula sp. P2]|uniref:hypothetical protein n=1 Tax=Rhodopirellula sp. P2 TaxID=2127060 RepID=UPI002368485D|nr:hypothetical protein [Rhodopirellula sp. P2]WDQ16386.1 hypothetical protein PSR62_22585 [Rhodopirellula sp. P2]
MLTDQERDQIRAMDDETYERQASHEELRQMRSLNTMAAIQGEFFREFASAINSPSFGPVEALPGLGDLRERASQTAEAIDQLRVMIARFCEIGETKIDMTGLVEIPDQNAYDAIDRCREVRQAREESQS